MNEGRNKVAYSIPVSLVPGLVRSPASEGNPMELRIPPQSFRQLGTARVTASHQRGKLHPGAFSERELFCFHKQEEEEQPNLASEESLLALNVMTLLPRKASPAGRAL